MTRSNNSTAGTPFVPSPLLSEADQLHLRNFEHMRTLLRDRTRSVALRYHHGAYFTGRPGSSKTVTISEELKQAKALWTYRNARMTAQGLWMLLSEHPEHTVVLDDIPTLVAEKPALQVLMAALGGVPGEPRLVTYTTAENGGRKSFEFRGAIIAISNVPLRRDPLVDAVQSRIPILEHEPSDEMLAAFMRDHALKGGYELPPDDALRVIEFVIRESQLADYRLNLRTAAKAVQDFKLVRDGNAALSWEELVDVQGLIGQMSALRRNLAGWVTPTVPKTDISRSRCRYGTASQPPVNRPPRWGLGQRSQGSGR